MRNAKKIRRTKWKERPVDLFESQVTFHSLNEWRFVSVLTACGQRIRKSFIVNLTLVYYISKSGK